MIPKAKLRRFANTNHSRVNLLVRTAASGSAAVGALHQRLDAAIVAAHLPPELTAVVTGNTVVFAEASDGIAGNQLSSMVLSAVSILILMVVSVRSFGVGLVAMAPNLGPVVIFFGLLGAGLADLSLPTSLIGSVALGIALDDTAHFIVNYQRMRAEGLAAADAAARCLRELGLPIVTTSADADGGLPRAHALGLRDDPSVRLALRPDDPNLSLGRSADAPRVAGSNARLSYRTRRSRRPATVPCLEATP